MYGESPVKLPVGDCTPCPRGKYEGGMNLNWILPLASATLGFGAGAIFGGGKLVQQYDWQTEWMIDAPLGFVYQILTMPEEQGKWWPSMRVAHVAPLPDDPDGRIIEYHVKQAQSVAR